MVDNLVRDLPTASFGVPAQLAKLHFGILTVLSGGDASVKYRCHCLITHHRFFGVPMAEL
jgi:hypothetical protein